MSPTHWLRTSMCAVLVLLFCQGAVAQLNMIGRVDTAYYPKFLAAGPNPRISADELRSDAAFLGLSGAVASIKWSYEMEQAGKDELAPSGEVKLTFDSHGNVSQIETQGLAGCPPEQAAVEFRHITIDGQQVRAACRTAKNAAVQFTGVKYEHDAMGRVARILSNSSAAKSVTIEYGENGQVERMTTLHREGGGTLYEYGDSGCLEKTSDFAEDPSLATPSLHCEWKDDRSVKMTSFFGQVKQKIEVELSYDEHGSIVRFQGPYTYGLPVIADRAITRDDQGNWTSIVESIRSPVAPDAPARIFGRVTQTIEYAAPIMEEPKQP